MTLPTKPFTKLKKTKVSPVDRKILDKITYIRRRGLFQQFAVQPWDRELESMIILGRAILDAGLVDVLEDMLANTYYSAEDFLDSSHAYAWFDPEGIFVDDMDEVSLIAALDPQIINKVVRCVIDGFLKEKFG